MEYGPWAIKKKTSLEWARKSGNLNHPVIVSGMHCWHQKVRVERAYGEDRYGDVFVDRNKAYEVYKQWLAMTRPQLRRADGLRRLLWMIRPYRPAAGAFKR